MISLASFIVIIYPPITHVIYLLISFNIHNSSSHSTGKGILYCIPPTADPEPIAISVFEVLL